MKQRRRSKVLFIVNTLMLIMLFTIPLYAYWGGLINGSSANDDENTIEIGKGQEITTTVELSNKTLDGGKLVPIGRKVEATDVEQVVLTFDVLWTDEDAASHGADGTLTITPSFDTNPSSLLKVVVNGDGPITAGTTKTITLTITLTEPADLAEYDLVANKTFTLAITFKVA